MPFLLMFHQIYRAGGFVAQEFRPMSVLKYDYFVAIIPTDL